MKIEPVTVTLKNGKSVVIREATIEDAEELIAVIKQYVGESDFIPFSSDEYNPTKEAEEAWIYSFTKRDNCLLLVATYENRIIGNIDLTGSQRSMLQHTAVVGIGVLKKWTNQGLGSVLFDLIIGWAKRNPMLEQLLLNTFATNNAGMALYRKFGFSETGRYQGYIKSPCGNYVDNILMTLNIK